MPAAREGAEVPTTLAAEAAELGRAHFARWLDDLLPAGSCLVWAGGLTLAAVLATDRRRTVLLVETQPGDLEASARRPQAGVALGGPDAVTSGARFDGGVIVVDDVEPESVVGPLLKGALREAAIAVITEPSRVDSVVAVLHAAGRPAVVRRQDLRLVSVLGIGDAPARAELLSGGADPEPSACVVLAGIDAPPSVLVGRDAGPSAQWVEADWVRRSLREIDTELRAEDAMRLRELEGRLADTLVDYEQLRVHTVGLEQRIDELQTSTSWRVSAPLRWLSDRARRR